MAEQSAAPPAVVTNTRPEIAELRAICLTRMDATAVPQHLLGGRIAEKGQNGQPVGAADHAAIGQRRARALLVHPPTPVRYSQNLLSVMLTSGSSWLARSMSDNLPSSEATRQRAA